MKTASKTTSRLQEVTLRPMGTQDMEFLYRVYAGTRAEEMALVPWSDGEKEAFLRMQFNAQHTHYQKHFPDASYQVVERAGQPVGRIYVDRRADEIRIIDIALLPEERGSGIGGALLREVLEEAAGNELPVRIHVEKHNPALRLYHRLGFREIQDQEVYWLMEWTPSGQAGEAT